MVTIRFGDFLFPNNPRKIEIQWTRRLPVFSGVLCGAHAQNLGRQLRVVSGQGEFFGAAAVGQFESLCAAFELERAQTLVLPLQQPFRAYFSKLRMLGEPGPTVIQYAFEFLECESPALAGTQTHQAAGGENLFSIAAAYDGDVDALTRLNPDLPGPYAVRPGDRILIR